MKFQKVTIYIAAYNAEKTILSCVNSIINQTIKFDEILIIDDKSTDNTVKLLENFQNDPSKIHSFAPSQLYQVHFSSVPI